VSTKAGTTNRNTRASSGPSGDGPSGLQRRILTRRACVLTGRKPQPKHPREFRPVRRRALRVRFVRSFEGSLSMQAIQMKRAL
jgi:hypothetical protein